MSADAEVIEGEFEAARDVAAAPLALRVDEPVRSLVTPEQARESWADYERLKAAIATPDDFQEFPDKKSGTKRRFPKKSFVKKIQTFFGISVTTRDMVRDDLGEGHFGFRVVGIATAPNGRVVESSGGCSTFEERFELTPYGDESPQRFAIRQKKALARAYHDVLSTAETRATNRAVMNLIGGGEVTADEVSRDRGRTDEQRHEPEGPVRVQTSELLRLCDRAGIPNLGSWLATHVAPDLPDRKPRPMLTPEESIKAKQLLEQLDPVIDTDVEDETPPPEPVQATTSKPSERQKGLLFALHSELGHNDGDRHLLYKRIVGKESFKDLTSADVAKIIDALSART